MKAYWGMELQLHTFLTSALDGGEWSVSRSGRFTPRERAPGTHWIRDWVGSRAGLEAVVKRKITHPIPGLGTPDHPARSQRCTTELSRPPILGK